MFGNDEFDGSRAVNPEYNKSERAMEEELNIKERRPPGIHDEPDAVDLEIQTPDFSIIAPVTATVLAHIPVPVPEPAHVAPVTATVTATEPATPDITVAKDPVV